MEVLSLNRNFGRAWVAPAVAAHVEELAPRLRDADRREIRAAFGRPAEAILQSGFRNARRCWTVLAGDRPVAMFGVGRRRSPRIGTVWFLASEDFVRARDLVRREGRYWVDVLMTGHDVLTNFVAADNRIAVRWISWLGFELLTLHRGIGTGGEDFWEFAAFRPGARPRFLPGASPAKSTTAADSSSASSGGESGADAQPARAEHGTPRPSGA